MKCEMRGVRLENGHIRTFKMCDRPAVYIEETWLGHKLICPHHAVHGDETRIDSARGREMLARYVKNRLIGKENQ